MARTGWILYDPDTDTTVVLPVNPYSDGGYTKSRRVSSSYSGMYQASGGTHTVATIVYNQEQQPEKLNYTGRVYTEEEFNLITEWVNKNNPVHLTDDLGRKFEILFEAIAFDRVRSVQNPYKHEYQLTATVLGMIEE